MTATLDRLSNGRLLINVVTGGDPIENKGDGIHFSHEERYEVTEEFLHIYKALLLRAKPSTTRVSTSTSKMARFSSPLIKTRIRRFISAVRRASGNRLRPARSTSI